jgi:hypothetical protein
LCAESWHNYTHNLFKPLLLFFSMGFLVPILGIELRFPHVLYQALTIPRRTVGGPSGGRPAAIPGNGCGLFGLCPRRPEPIPS